MSQDTDALREAALIKQLRSLGYYGFGESRNAHGYFNHTGGRTSLGEASDFYDKAVRLAREAVAALSTTPAPERRDEWQPIETAPRDRLIEVYAPEYECLNATISLCQWHEDAGFCICELRTPTHWREHNPPALRTTTAPAEGGRT